MLLCQSSSSAANEDGFDPTLGCVVAAEIEEMNKARGQRMGEAREREVDAKGRSFATGHKKTAIARVCLTPGEGLMHVNGRPIDLYFPYYRRYQMLLPFELTGTLLSFDMSAKVHGGGLAGQLDALKYGIARALQKQDPAFRDILKAGNLPACLPACLPVFLPACLPVCLPAPARSSLPP